jgi:hypothetical protein
VPNYEGWVGGGLAIFRILAVKFRQLLQGGASGGSANDSLLHPAGRGVTPRPPVTPGRLPDRARHRPEGALLTGTSVQVRRVVEPG